MVGTVLVEESPVNLECKVTQVIPLEGSCTLLALQGAVLTAPPCIADPPGKP